MNFLAGVLLMYLPSEADAYGALVVLMQHRRMRELYKEDLAWLQARCCRS
jgi:Rab-GTPase-TBC domain